MKLSKTKSAVVAAVFVACALQCKADVTVGDSISSFISGVTDKSGSTTYDTSFPQQCSSRVVTPEPGTWAILGSFIALAVYLKRRQDGKAAKVAVAKIS